MRPLMEEYAPRVRPDDARLRAGNGPDHPAHSVLVSPPKPHPKAKVGHPEDWRDRLERPDREGVGGPSPPSPTRKSPALQGFLLVGPCLVAGRPSSAHPPGLTSPVSYARTTAWTRSR